MNPEDKISTYFTWKEAIWLPRWSRMAKYSDGLNGQTIENLKLLFSKMDVVREFLNLPIIVHCAYRPKLYNQEIGGAENSAHMALEPGVAAVDFHVEGRTCMSVKLDLLSMLTVWNVRMENNGFAASWIHVDIGRPGTRYFPP